MLALGRLRHPLSSSHSSLCPSSSRSHDTLLAHDSARPRNLRKKTFAPRVQRPSPAQPESDSSAGARCFAFSSLDALPSFLSSCLTVLTLYRRPQIRLLTDDLNPIILQVYFFTSLLTLDLFSTCT